MKKNNSLIFGIGILFIFACSNEMSVADSVKLQSRQDSVSYSLGNDVGSTFKARGFKFESETFYKGFSETYQADSSYAYGASLAANFILQDINIDPKVFFNAFESANKGDSLILQSSDMKRIVREYNQELRDNATRKAQLAADKNKQIGVEFIEEYKKNNESATVLESGLIYKVLQEGFGEVPKDTNRVTVHYTGKLIDGTVFDSSVERGEPAKFPVGSVIKGWQEALQLMKVGSKWELVIPANLAYGERSTGNIPGSSTLIFDVELLAIE